MGLGAGALAVRTAARKTGLLVAAALLGFAAHADPGAVTGVVTGNVQKVGFRALILRQAIRYNLAGEARNEPDGTVRFSLQGTGERISRALTELRKGTGKSSDVKVTTESAAPREGLVAFTVVAWTSSTREISKPYDLVFALRSPDGVVSAKEARRVYHRILEETLEPADRARLHGR